MRYFDGHRRFSPQLGFDFLEWRITHFDIQDATLIGRIDSARHPEMADDVAFSSNKCDGHGWWRPRSWILPCGDVAILIDDGLPPLRRLAGKLTLHHVQIPDSPKRLIDAWLLTEARANDTHKQKRQDLHLR
jgi:hypothetical protein